MTSQFSSENITFSNSARTPGLTKGSVLAHNNTDQFEPTAPGADGQALTADSSESNGITWTGSSIGGNVAGFCTIASNVDPGEDFQCVDIDGNINAEEGPNPIIAPACELLHVTLCPSNVGGWATVIFGSINGGTVDINFGFWSPPTVTTNPANFTLFPGAPHAQLAGTTIGSNNNIGFSVPISPPIAVAAGTPVGFRLDDNLTNSGFRIGSGSSTLMGIYRLT